MKQKRTSGSVVGMDGISHYPSVAEKPRRSRVFWAVTAPIRVPVNLVLALFDFIVDVLDGLFDY